MLRVPGEAGVPDRESSEARHQANGETIRLVDVFGWALRLLALLRIAFLAALTSAVFDVWLLFHLQWWAQTIAGPPALTIDLGGGAMLSFGYVSFLKPVVALLLVCAAERRRFTTAILVLQLPVILLQRIFVVLVMAWLIY